MPERKEQKQLRNVLKGYDEGSLKYEPKEKKEIDFNRYTIAQVNEINNVLILIRRVVDEAYVRIPDMTRLGRPSKSVCDKAKAVLMQQFFQCSNRVAEGFVQLFKEKLGIKEYLTYKDIERAYEDPEVTLIIHIAHQLSNEPVKAHEKDFCIDGTGLPESYKQNYASEKDKSKGKNKEMKGYEKLIAIFGNKYKLIGACDIAENFNDHESPYLKPLLDELMQIYEELNLFQADRAYLSRENCKIIASYGGTPRIYPKSNSTLKRRGSLAWTQMMLAFITDPQKWLEEYHGRSISESGNSVIKRRFPRNLLKKDDTRRKSEAFSRTCVYNLRQLNYIHYLCSEITVSWLN